MLQRVETSALVLTLSSQPENSHLRKKHVFQTNFIDLMSMVYPISRTRLSFTFEITMILTIVIYRHPKSGGTHVPSSCIIFLRTHAGSCVLPTSPPLSHHLPNNRLAKTLPPSVPSRTIGHGLLVC
jgi:hypothetical protein